ncbi:short chain dehydrogenase [Hyaloraphidium curvatum]|nr:short chain dehydrogenase [Hyaloraphidium curvatum]
MSLRDKVVFLSGGSRGIGLASAIRLAKEGAKIVITGKTTDTNPKLPGTIYSAAEDCKAAGAPDAIGIPCDIRDEKQVIEAVNKAVQHFGGIDILINNASAISITPTEKLGTKMFDLMNSINLRGTWLVTKYCIPHLKESARKGRNPHIVNMSPPVILEPDAIGRGTAYALAKYGMSLQVLGHSAELREAGVAANGLWPWKGVFTAAIRNVLAGDSAAPYCFRPDIQADALFVIVSQDSKAYTGNLTIDAMVLESQGIKDMTVYKVDPTKKDSEMMGMAYLPAGYTFTLPPKKVLSAPSYDLLALSRSKL